MRIKKKNGKRFVKIEIPKRVAKLDKWCDKDYLIFFVVGMLFEKYVDGEEGGLHEIYDRIKYAKDEIQNAELEWDRDYWSVALPHLEEIVNLYKFWKALPKFRKRIEKETLKMSADTYYYLYWDDKLTQLEDQFMRRVIDIRRILWT